MSGWIRPKDKPLPDEHRMTLRIRDPEIIALLIRGVPHGKISDTLLRLIREGYDRLVATKALVPSEYLTDEELAGNKAARRNSRRTTPTKAVTAAETAPSAVIPLQPSAPLAAADGPAAVGVAAAVVPPPTEFRLTPTPPPPPSPTPARVPSPPPVTARPPVAADPIAPEGTSAPMISADDANIMLGALG